MSTDQLQLPGVLTVIVTHRSARHVVGLLDSLPSGLTGVDNRGVVVVDNASDDGTAARARAHPCGPIVIESGHNAGYAAAINLGVQRAWDGVSPILVLNPDVRLGPGCAAALVAALQRPGTGIAVPRLVDRRGKLQHSLRRRPTVARAWGEALLGGRMSSRVPSLGEVVGDPVAYELSHDVDWATGAVLLVSGPCQQALGQWDETFFLYSEETELCLRAHELGYRTRYVPQAFAVHSQGGSGESPWQWELQAVNKVRLFSRRSRTVARGAFGAGVLVNELVRAAASAKHRAGARAVAEVLRHPHVLANPVGPPEQPNVLTAGRGSERLSPPGSPRRVGVG